MKNVVGSMRLLIVGLVFSCTGTSVSSAERNGTADFLDTLADVLNSSINLEGESYTAKRNQSISFFVFDLSDTLNYSPKDLKLGKNSKFTFRDKHVYHFAPLFMRHSISFIVVAHNGKLKFFKGLNCPEGDTVEDVIAYVKASGVDDQVVETHIRAYRTFGEYLRTDHHSHVDCSYFIADE